MIGVTLGALTAHWRRRPGQAATLVLGLALATALWSAVQAINAEARASYDAASAFADAGQTADLISETGSIPLARYVDLRRAGWQVTPVLEGRARLGGAFVTVMGVDALSYPVLPVDTLDPDDDPLDLLLAPGRLFATQETASRIGQSADLPPLSVSDTVPPGLVLTDIGTAERLLDQSGQVTRIVVLPDQPTGLPPLEGLAPDLVLDTPDTGVETARLTRSFHLNLTAFGLLSFAVGLFIVHGTIGLAFEQRRGLVRTLRAVGVPARRVLQAMLLELVVIGLLSGVAGLALGYLAAGALLPNVAATLRGLYGADVAGSLTLRPGWVASGLVMALCGILLAGGQTILRLRSLPILSLPGAEAWRGASASGLWVQAACGAGLIALGILAIVIFDGLVARFLFLGGLLIGAALWLTPLLSLALDTLARVATGPVAQWLWSDSRTQLPGLSMALMALLLALATNIGVGTMVSSFRLTFTGWLDQRLASELYVTARDAEQAQQIRAFLAPRADAVLPIRYAQANLGDRPGRIYGIVDHATYRDTWPVIAQSADMWDQLHSGNGALLSEQLARRAGLWLGDTVTLRADWQVPVLGIYSDYGNPNGQAVVALDDLISRFPDVPDRQYGVRTNDPDGVARALRAAFDLPADSVVDQTRIKALSLDVFDNTFIVTGALNVLTLGVAAFAILTSLLTLWTMRLPHLAPVWALGLTRAQLARLELGRSLALAALTAGLALPLGLVLAWALLAVINVEAFGWRLPMFLFPGDWLRLFLAALVAAALAALLPAIRLGRMPPAELVKVFSDER